jgi:hypothetical protein
MANHKQLGASGSTTWILAFDQGNGRWFAKSATVTFSEGFLEKIEIDGTAIPHRFGMYGMTASF